MEIEKLANKRKVLLYKVRGLLKIAQVAQQDPVSKLKDFEVRFEDLSLLVSQFEEVHFEIVSQVEDKDIEEQEAIQTEFDDCQYSIKVIYKDLTLQRLVDVPSTAKGSRASSNHSHPNCENANLHKSGVNASCNKIKLPKIVIPKFDGSFKDWPTFYALFRTLIHENNSLSDIEKYQYMVSSLSKEALAMVQGLPLTSDNYKISFQQLVDRYQNKHFLLTSYWQSIYNAPKANMDSATSLRSLLAIFSENSLALEQFNYDMWNFTRLNLLLQKLDSVTRKRFEVELHDVELPTYEDLYAFLLKHCKALETNLVITGQPTSSLKSKPEQKQSVKFGQNANRVNQSFTFVTSAKNSNSNTLYNFKCVCCKEDHSLLKCDRFLQLDPFDRHKLAKDCNLCFNCLTRGHALAKCLSKFRCRICKQRHHTYLHFTKPESSHPSSSTDKEVSQQSSASEQLSVLTNTVFKHSVVLLSTVLLHIRDSAGNFQTCRALLDNGSQASFMTRTCVKRLGLKAVPSSIDVHGLNTMTMSSCGVASCFIKPIQNSNIQFEIDVIIVPSIANSVPSAPVSKRWDHLKDLSLADPYYGRPREVDLLLGADIYSSVLLPGLRHGHVGEPTAVNTVFGWVIGGKTGCSSNAKVKSLCTTVSVPLDTVLRQFWETEQVPETVLLSPEDSQCEAIFKETYKRNKEGRFVLHLPFRETSVELGDSYSMALRRFEFLERRLARDCDLADNYKVFMKDYLDSGHMSLVTKFSGEPLTRFYIPHHCVIKPDSATSKLRVVFDASAKSSNGTSLNDILLVGPKLQRDLTGILLNFRLHQFVLTADIKQMYRQIEICEQHRAFQRILWRFSKSDPIGEYQLNTVTYGVSSSPFLAIRVLLQLAEDNWRNYPLAAKVLMSDTYIDDVVTGCNSIDSALNLQQQLISLLSSAGFTLRKWASNHCELLSSLPVEDLQPVCFDDSDSLSVKVLGLQWDPRTDCFQYKVEPSAQICTKRGILSDIARVFDPIGLLTPVIFLTKHLMQQLWSLGLDWDDKPPSEVVDRWLSYNLQLPCLANLTIPRHIQIDNAQSVQLHGFCDASEAGYAAAIYIRCVTLEGNISVKLVYAKSKVAPLKRISLPRLELCAAVLLSNLVEYVSCVYKNLITPDQIYAWSDSTVVLSWIKSSPHRWKTFVSNRISHIQDKIAPHQWHHVSGVDNPADCASRGLMPSDLVNHSMWWFGPTFLYNSNEYSSFDALEIDPVVESEQRKLNLLNVVPFDEINVLLNRFSSLRKIQGVVAYCLRFGNNLRSEVHQRKTGSLVMTELHKALLVIVKIVQHEVFLNEIDCIEKGKVCAKSIQKLAPFIDSDNLVRVGGRLRHSELLYDAKHPLLLPRDHRLSELIVEYTHRKYLHPGPQTLGYLISQQFWVLGLKRVINRVLSKCVQCFKVKPTSLSPLMGDLPAPRISQIKPFSHAGLDFAGPLAMTSRRGRGAKHTKVYICIFVCMATKALHIELVSELSSDAFLAALRRFIARRGRCSDLYSDQGTNFVGASRLLIAYAQEVSGSLAINWHFNPPASPHFGGIWEGGVRSIKTHLYRVIGDQVLTYEELLTVLVQIEAVLNSRPLYSPSCNPNDLSVLTPGHFLTLEPLTCPPDPDVTNLKLNRLSRWQLLQRMHQDFWKRWSSEYLHSLQQREKWIKSSSHVNIHDLVLIKDSNSPPLQWKLGRVVALFPGRDGVVRVARVRTQNGELDRPLVKLCPLPLCN